MALHILLERGLTTGTITIHMHESWEYLKYALTGSKEVPPHVNGPDWDRHDAWVHIRNGNLIVDGPSMWQYVNGYEFSGLDDLVSKDLFQLESNREIFVFQEMDDAESYRYFIDRRNAERITYAEWVEAGFDKKHLSYLDEIGRL